MYDDANNIAAGAALMTDTKVTSEYWELLGPDTLTR